MSFLYDAENYHSIINHAFPKLAQQATPVAVDPNLVGRLAERLNAELSLAAGDKYVPNTPGQEGADLKYDDLKFEKLLSFLSSHKIKFGPADKDRIAFTKDEFTNALPSDLKETDKENYDVVGDYYVNAPALIDYIKYLQGKLGAQGNPLINARLKLLIDETNQRLPGANLGRNHSKDLPQAAGFKDTDELDKLNNTFSPKYGVKEGPNSLTVGDLKTKEGLNAWLQNHQAQVVTYDEKGMFHKLPYVKAKDIESAWKMILKSLYDRAVRLRSLATSPELAKKYDYYKKLLVGLGAEGGAAVGAGQGGATRNVNYQGQQGEGGGDVNFNQIMDSLPLGDDIDLNRINVFFQQVQALYTGSTNKSRAGVINSYIDAAKSAMTNLEGVTDNLRIVRENTLPKDFALFLKPNASSYGPAINLLYSIVNYTRQVIATLNSDYASAINADASWRNKIVNQMEFYYGKNRNLLQDLIRNANQVAR